MFYFFLSLSMATRPWSMSQPQPPRGEWRKMPGCTYVRDQEARTLAVHVPSQLNRWLGQSGTDSEVLVVTIIVVTAK